MTPSAEYMNQPFELAIKFFRNKVNLPTENWDDLWQGMHARAFVVAGAMKSDLLCDLRSAVDKAISQGTTLAEFRKDFDALVDKHGWSYEGGRKWRSAVIYNTNLSVAYASGHYEAMQEVKKLRPFWRYVPSSSKNPRDDHRQWYNTVLPADDPFWDTHYPPNDWGCKCGVTNHSAREVERLKKKFEGTEFPISEERPEVTHYEWVDKRNHTHVIPKGIGPGWDYNPGKAAWGKKLETEAMEEWKAKKKAAWDPITPGNYRSYERPAVIPMDPPLREVGPKLTTIPAAEEALKEILGGEAKTFLFDKIGFRYPVRIDAKVMAEHVDLNRTPFLSLIPEILTDPYEVWQCFEKHGGTGKVILRTRFFRAFEGSRKKGYMVVLDAQNGFFEGWTFIPTDKSKDLNPNRYGRLVYAREE